jgi:hypothetical protein
LKYFICALSIILTFSSVAFCQDNASAADYPDTAPQSTIDNAVAADTGTTYYSKLDINDFRRANWGMTKAQVRACETAPVDDFKQNFIDSAAVDAFYYKSEFAGYGVTIKYGFTNDTLTSALYTFELKPGVYAADQFNQIKAVMDKDYWVAEYDENNWDKFGNDSYTLEYGIAGGQADRNVQWNTDRSNITLGIYSIGVIMIELGYWDNRQQ